MSETTVEDLERVLDMEHIDRIDDKAYGFRLVGKNDELWLDRDDFGPLLEELGLVVSTVRNKNYSDECRVLLQPLITEEKEVTTVEEVQTFGRTEDE